MIAYKCDICGDYYDNDDEEFTTLLDFNMVACCIKIERLIEGDENGESGIKTNACKKCKIRVIDRIVKKNK